MPVIKSAIKKLRQDKKREKVNDKIRASLRSAVRIAEKSKNAKTVTKAISTVDKAAKNKIIHENKASRIKSKLSKLAKPAKLTEINKPDTGTTKVRAIKKNSPRKNSK